MRRARRVTRSLIAVLLIGAAVEAGSAGSTAYLARRGAMAYIPSFSNQAIADYLRERDPDLGWGRALNDAGVRVAVARPDPAFPSSPSPCVSIYGDSFTHGSGVGDEETFAHDLALALGCRVANYGVGAFGSDQALMLARLQRTDEAPVTILAHLSENILRNVNQYRNLLISSSDLVFKPRYVLDHDGLRSVPIPVSNAGDFSRLRTDPASVLQHEAFLDRPRRSFPFVRSLSAYVFRDPHVRATIARMPWWVPFYQPDHPSQALPLTARILETFAQEARQRGRTGVIALLPTAADLEYVKRTGAWPDQPLVDLLNGRGVSVVHVGPDLQAGIVTDACEAFLECDGHLTAQGHQIVARRLRAAIAPFVPSTRPTR